MIFSGGGLVRNLQAISAVAFAHLHSLSQLAELANSLWHSQFISVFMCECLFIYFAPNRPICRHHLPTQIAGAHHPSLSSPMCPSPQPTRVHSPRWLG